MENSSTSTVTNPTITNQTGFLFRDYTSYFSVKLRLNFLFAEKMPQFSFIWCDLILCLSSDLKGVDALNISIPDCLWTRDESVSKRRQKSFLVEGCQVTIQSSLCWCLLCVSSKKCTIGRQASSDMCPPFKINLYKIREKRVIEKQGSSLVLSGYFCTCTMVLMEGGNSVFPTW